MRIVAAISVAFVVLVGVVAVTYPNESDEVRQRNAAFMKLGDIKGEVKADDELLGYRFRDYPESNELINDTINSQTLQRLDDIEDRDAKDDPDCALEKILSWDCPTWMRCVGDAAEHFNRFRASYPLVEYVTEGEDCY